MVSRRHHIRFPSSGWIIRVVTCVIPSLAARNVSPANTVPKSFQTTCLRQTRLPPSELSCPFTSGLCLPSEPDTAIMTGCGRKLSGTVFEHHLTEFQVFHAFSISAPWDHRHFGCFGKLRTRPLRPSLWCFDTVHLPYCSNK